MRPLLHVLLNKQRPCTPLSRDIRERRLVSIYSALRLLFTKIDLDLISLSTRAKRGGCVEGSDKDGRKREKGRKQTQTGRRVDQSAKRQEYGSLRRVRREGTFCCPHDALEAETSGGQNTQRDRSSCVAFRKYLGRVGGYFH